MRLYPDIIYTAAVVAVAYMVPPYVLAQEDAGDSTLKEQLEATNAEFTKQMPEEVINDINTAVDEVTETDILERAIKTGDRAPDFTLPDAVGNTVKLSSLLKEGPVILTWYRGNW